MTVKGQQQRKTQRLLRLLLKRELGQELGQELGKAQVHYSGGQVTIKVLSTYLGQMVIVAGLVLAGRHSLPWTTP